MNKAIAFNRWLTQISISSTYSFMTCFTFHLYQLWLRTWPNYNSELNITLKLLPISTKLMRLGLMPKHFHTSKLIHILVLYQQHVKTLQINKHTYSDTNGVHPLSPPKPWSTSPISSQTICIYNVLNTCHTQYSINTQIRCINSTVIFNDSFNVISFSFP